MSTLVWFPYDGDRPFARLTAQDKTTQCTASLIWAT